MDDHEVEKRKVCKYGHSCYQKNKVHLDKFYHPNELYQKQAEAGIPERPLKKVKVNNEVKEVKVYTSPRIDSSELKKHECEQLNDRPKEVLISNKIRTEHSKMLNLKSDLKEVIKQLFLVEMPDDFYSFWEMCKTLNSSDPQSALKPIKLQLVGPFDVLAGRISNVYGEDIPDILRHWRFYFDPPEFQTVLVKEGPNCLHFGYFRDDPKELPVFVASNELNPKNPENNGNIKVVSQNLFGALNSFLEELKTDPFSRMKIPKFQKVLATWVKENGFSLDKEPKKRNVVAKTFHGAGIVVPIDKKNDVGYRELAASNSMIKKILKGIVDSKTEEERMKFWEQLQPIITFANIANDECDFGTTLELGLDLFSYGSPLLHRSAQQLLTTAYNLLGRSEFAQIIQAHIENRREGKDLSVL